MISVTPYFLINNIFLFYSVSLERNLKFFSQKELKYRTLIILPYFRKILYIAIHQNTMIYSLRKLFQLL